MIYITLGVILHPTKSGAEKAMMREFYMLFIFGVIIVVLRLPIN